MVTFNTRVVINVLRSQRKASVIIWGGGAVVFVPL